MKEIHAKVIIALALIIAVTLLGRGCQDMLIKQKEINGSVLEVQK